MCVPARIFARGISRSSSRAVEVQVLDQLCGSKVGQTAEESSVRFEMVSQTYPVYFSLLIKYS